jgi:hypothetical protein
MPRRCVVGTDAPRRQETRSKYGRCASALQRSGQQYSTACENDRRIFGRAQAGEAKGRGCKSWSQVSVLGLRQNAKARRTDATAMICCLTLSSPGNTLRMRLFHNHETAHMAALLRPSCSKVTKNRICRSLGIIWLIFRESFDKFSKLFRLPKAASLDLLLSVIVCRYNAAQKA